MIEDSVYYTDICTISMKVLKHVKHPVLFLVAQKPREDWTRVNAHEERVSDDEGDDAVSVLLLASCELSLSQNTPI